VKLELKRQNTVGLSVPGHLKVDGEPNCDTLESTTVWIPSGEYSVEMTYSPHFQRMMPLVDGVPGRSAIRVHPGNTVLDTDGCILVGTNSNDTSLTNSRAASDSLNSLITDALANGESVTLVIS
jgi:hypothetical protein